MRPAFVHLLHVDPRLKIDSISIQEDNVERLVRYSRSGEDVTLFLRDRAAATQDLVLSGSMPIELGREMKLPTVSLVGATVTDARLLLQPDAQVDLAVIECPAAAAALRRGTRRRTPFAPAREYLLRAGRPLPEVRVTQRAEQPRRRERHRAGSQSPRTVDVGVYLRFSGTRGEEGPFEITIPAGARRAVHDRGERRKADPPARGRHVRRAPGGASGQRAGRANPLASRRPTAKPGRFPGCR